MCVVVRHVLKRAMERPGDLRPMHNCFECFGFDFIPKLVGKGENRVGGEGGGEPHRSVFNCLKSMVGQRWKEWRDRNCVQRLSKMCFVWCWTLGWGTVTVVKAVKAVKARANRAAMVRVVSATRQNLSKCGKRTTTHGCLNRRRVCL